MSAVITHFKSTVTHEGLRKPLLETFGYFTFRHLIPFKINITVN